MQAPKWLQFGLGGVLLLALLAHRVDADTLKNARGSAYDNSKTEIDLTLGRPEAAALYRRPRGVQNYRYDKTEVDLASPTKAGSRLPSSAPGGAAPKAQPPGSDR